MEGLRPCHEGQNRGSSAGPSSDNGDEPYLGQEFESEADAHTFYNAYAKCVGFIVRSGQVSKSRRDGSHLGRTLLCNKEGYRLPDKRETIMRQRKVTRFGCKAMIFVKKIDSDKWIIKKCEKEHSHPLDPSEARDCIYDKYPTEHARIQELTKQLAAEKKLSQTYRRLLEMILEQIEEHNETLFRKIQCVVDNVNEAENKEQESHQ